MPQYLNKVNGDQYEFASTPEAGHNIDTGGDEYFLIDTGGGWLDALSGEYLLPLPAFLTPFQSLRATRIPLTLTNDASAGLRQSMAVGGTGVTAAGMVDTLTIDGDIELIGASAALTNLVDTVITTAGGWSAVNAVLSDEGGYVYKINDDSTGGTGVVLAKYDVVVATSTAHTASVALKADQLNWAFLQGSAAQTCFHPRGCRCGGWQGSSPRSCPHRPAATPTNLRDPRCQKWRRA